MQFTTQEIRIATERRCEAYAAAHALWLADDTDDARELEHTLILKAMAWVAEIDSIVEAERAPGPTPIPTQTGIDPAVLGPSINASDPYAQLPDGVRLVYHRGRRPDDLACTWRR